MALSWIAALTVVLGSLTLALITLSPRLIQLYQAWSEVLREHEGKIEGNSTAITSLKEMISNESAVQLVGPGTGSGVSKVTQ